MASLYDPMQDNNFLLSQRHLRHRRINLDYEYISRFPYDNQQLLQNVNWYDINFNNAEVNAINNVQGIYMFYINPYSYSMCNHPTGEVILYIGQAKDLRTRLNKYFYYPNSRKASDQEKRYMILFFSTLLKVKIWETNNLSQADLDIVEYSLIDSILPPMNLKVHSQCAQVYRRLINP